MSEEPVPYYPTQRAELLSLRVRVDELEDVVRSLDRASMDLFHYIRNVDGLPDWDEWREIRAQIAEMIDGVGEPDGRGVPPVRPAR
ncbi:MAG TPA: hypothetical protein VIG24_19540 [Acidimicrobiia bacterium]